MGRPGRNLDAVWTKRPTALDRSWRRFSGMAASSLVAVLAWAAVSSSASAGSDWALNLPQTAPLAPAPPTTQALDTEMRELAGRLSAKGDPLVDDFQRLLGTPVGRLVVGKSVAVTAETDVRQRAAEALQSISTGGEVRTGQAEGAGGTSLLFAAFSARADSFQGEFDAFRSTLVRVRNGLKAGTAIDDRLRRVLNEPGAAEAIYLVYLFPLAVPHPLYTSLGSLFSMNAEGRLAISESSRARTEALINKLNPIGRAVDGVIKARARIADAIEANDPLHQRFKRQLRDPAVAALSVVRLASRKPTLEPAQLAESVAKATLALLERTGQSVHLTSKIDPARITASLDDNERMTAAMAIQRARLASFALKIAADDPLTRDGETTLGTNVALASIVLSAAKQKIKERFLGHTPFGGALLPPAEGGWRVNPKRKSAMHVYLDVIEGVLDAYDTALKDLKVPISDARGIELVARLAAVTSAVADRGGDPMRAWQAWLSANFEDSGKHLALRPSARDEIGNMVAEASTTSTALEGGEKAIVVDLSPQSFSDRHIRLLRSSAFYNPRTPFGQQIYMSEFPEHDTARIFGVFEIPGRAARDRRSYSQRFRQRNDFVLALGRNHRRIIFYIAHMPRWLSRSKESRQHNGLPAYEMTGPSDWNAWRQLVQEMVRFGKRIRGAAVYYEVWNEPEAYWTAGTDAYLRLYEETVRAIKEEDPTAKVGGAAVNQWDGRAGGSASGDPLNLELLGFVKRKGLPLDFLSWHHFGRPAADVAKAKAVYEKEIDRLGFSARPELIVSEWSPPGKNTPLEAVATAETMLALFKAGVDAQMIAAWEDFSPRPKPSGLGPWGMITQQGYKRPIYHVHELFDRLARHSRGIATFASDDQTTKVVVSRKDRDVYELLVWEAGYAPPLRAALQVLADGGLGKADFAPYGSLKKLERAISSASPMRKRHVPLFKEAQDVYRSKRLRSNFIVLDFKGIAHGEVLEHRVIGSALASRPVHAAGGRLVAELPNNEAMWLRLRVRR